MTFLEEVLHFELNVDFVEENRASQPSDYVTNEDKEQLKPTTKKARFFAFEPDDLVDEIDKSLQSQVKAKILHQMMFGISNKEVWLHNSTFTGKLNLKFADFVCPCIYLLLC